MNRDNTSSKTANLIDRQCDFIHRKEIHTSYCVCSLILLIVPVATTDIQKYFYISMVATSLVCGVITRSRAQSGSRAVC